jgi:energy-coupling factor transporter ATP-binding protein EcfA2
LYPWFFSTCSREAGRDVKILNDAIIEIMSDNAMTERIGQIADRGAIHAPKREGPLLPAAERAEQLWGLFSEYSSLRRNLYRTELTKQKGDEGVKKISQMSQEGKDAARRQLGEDPLSQRLEGEISHLWQDPTVKRIFTTKVRESMRELETHAPSLRKYQDLEHQSQELEEEYFDLLRNEFLMRQMTPTLRSMDIARNRTEQSMVRQGIEDLETTGGMDSEAYEERHGLDREHADLSALLAYERISDYHQQFKHDGVIFTPSRTALLERVLKKTSSGTWMQLVGETGTGKTTFAKRASWILNNEAAQYASGEKWGDVRALIGTKTMDPATQRVYYDFGPLTTALTGCQNSLEMEAAIRDGRETPGRLLILDELNKFDQDALFGALKIPATLQPGEMFNFKELPGIKLRMARRGVAIVTTMNPATVRYERKELDPALDRLFYNGKERVDYPPMTSESPELYEICLGILMDGHGRIRVAKSELAPSFVEIEDAATGIVRQELNTDVRKHGALYRFALAAAEIQKSFTQKPNVARTATDEGFLEKTAFEMETLVRWMQGYSGEIEGGESLTTYLEKKLHDFHGNIDSINDRAIYERTFSHFGFNIMNPTEKPKEPYTPLTPIEMGYLTPRTLREVRRKGEEVTPRTRIYIKPDGEEINYLPTPMTIEGGELQPETVIEYDEKRYVYLGKDPENGDDNIIIGPLEEEDNG